MQSSKRVIRASKNLVRSMLYCGTLPIREPSLERSAQRLLQDCMRHAARNNTGRYVSRLTSGTLAVVMAGAVK